jgi:hypothetical protein
MDIDFCDPHVVILYSKHHHRHHRHHHHHHQVDSTMSVPLLEHIGGLEFNIDPLKVAKKKISMKLESDGELESLTLWHGSILNDTVAEDIEMEQPKGCLVSDEKKRWEAISCIEVIEHLPLEGNTKTH